MDLEHRLMDVFAYKTKYMMPPKLHTHLAYEIYYVHFGSCQYIIGDSIINLAPGDLMIMNGLSPHGPIMKELCIRTMVRFDEAYVLPLLSYPGAIDLLLPFRALRNTRWHLSEDKRNEMEQILAKMDRFHMQTTALSYNRMRTVFIELLLFIYECSEESLEVNAKAAEKEHRVNCVVSYIEANYMNEITLDELADSIHFNKYYLAKIFKEITGTTIFEYLNKRRINQAKVLFLMNKDSSVTDVCYQVGFKQLTHFSRNFKQLVGLSPEQYRRCI